MSKMKIEEVAMTIGVCTQTLERWYRFKRHNPDSEVAKQLPDFNYSTRDDIRAKKVRLWDSQDMWKLIEFKTNVKPGRMGKMGKYGGKGTNGKKSNSSEAGIIS